MTKVPKLLQSLWEHSFQSVGITSIEPEPNNRHILYVSPAFTQLTGYSWGESVGQMPGILHGPDTSASRLRTSETQFRAGKAHVYSVLHYRKDASSYQWIIMRAPHLSIAIITPEKRFQFRLFGTALSGVYGSDLTGRFIDELTPLDLWPVVTEHYRGVVETGEPLFAPISASNGRWYIEVSRLLLPLAHDGEIAFIMGADYRRELH